MITEDLSAFFDLNGFASTHTVGSTAGVICIIGETITGRSELDGSMVTMFDVMIKKTDITAPRKWQKLSFDSVSYTIDSVKDDGAVYTITLSTARLGETIGPA